MIRTVMNRLTSLFQPQSEPSSNHVRTLTRTARQPRSLARSTKPLRHHIGWTDNDGNKEPVFLSEAELATHGNILGRTGRGKSKFAQLLVRNYITHQRGCMVVDPKKQLVDDILADIAAHVRQVRCDAILKRLLLIEITPGSVPLLSAMHWQGEPFGDDRVARNARTAFLAKEADVLIEIIHQMAGEPQEGAPRIKRVLRDVSGRLRHDGQFGIIREL